VGKAVIRLITLL